MSSPASAPPPPRAPAPHGRVDAPLFVALYGAELVAIVLLLALNKRGDAALSTFALSRTGLIAGLAAIALVGVLFVIARRIVSVRRRAHARVGLTLALNALPVAFALLAGESFVRALSVDTPTGRVFADVRLLPRDWHEEVTRYRAILDRTVVTVAFKTFDAQLGWTIGRGQKSANGLYASSLEGMRSGFPGDQLAAVSSRRRIALVGDSFTFGMEVAFEDTWGRILERNLGGDTAVLNFGVDGYGVDQAYLRYERDVRPWRPDVVIFGIINHDFQRTLSVYSFVTFPEWQIPYPKPRFVLENGALRALNLPLPDPRALLDTPAVAQLPYVAHDPSYQPYEWRLRPWHRSQLVRLALSKARPWPAPRTEVSTAAAAQINTALLRAFLRRAKEEGTRALIAYFPARQDFRTAVAHDKAFGHKVMREAGIHYRDFTACIAAVPEDERFMVGGTHYTPRTNDALAACMRTALTEIEERHAGR
jgi:hypothetical protein